MIYDTCGHDANYTPSVRFNGQKAMVLRSHTTHVHGDEPGVGKGVKSGIVGGISEPIGHAAQVRAEGSPVIRHLDRFHMNNRNTRGEAIFVRDTATYPAPEDDDPVPGSLQLASASSEAEGASPMIGFVAPGGMPAPPAAPPATALPQAAPPLGTAPAPPAPTMLQRVGSLARFLGARAIPIIPLLAPSRLADGTLPVAPDGTLQGEPEALPQEEPRPQPVPAPDTARIDRPRCYVLTLHFSTPANGTVIEMRRQLDLQQAALNAKNPCRAAEDMAQYRANRPIGERARPLARERAIQENTARIRRLNPALDINTALDTARANASDKDAIHTLDMIAGGDPLVFSGLGNRSVNRSIGSQWGSGGKAAELAAYAQDQCQKGCPRMQTLLTTT